MRKIKFSHHYVKLWKIDTSEPITLVQVWNTDKKELMPEFLEYDTVYYSEGDKRNYVLGLSGKCMVLFFVDSNGNLFTTIRRSTLQKEQYYNTSVGCDFQIEYTED